MSLISCIAYGCVDDFTSILDSDYQAYVFNSRSVSGFLNLASSTFGASSFFDVGGCPVLLGCFTASLAFTKLDANSNSPLPPPSHDS